MLLLPERTWTAVRTPGAPWASSVLVTAAVALAYFLAARLSLALLEKPDGVAVFWPAAGVASGVLIVAGSAIRWPVVIGVMAATICANLLGDRDLWSSLVFAVANAGEAAIVAGLIERIYGSNFDLSTLRRVIGLFAATIAGTALSGILGTIGFMWFHSASASAPIVWLHWFASDALGTLTVAPLLIGLTSLARRTPSTREVTEGAFALAVVFVLCALMVLLPNEPWTWELAMISVSPVFVWIAARLPPGFTTAATFICAIAIVSTTTFAIGIFGDSRWSWEQRIQYAQASILAISFSALVLAALFNERKLQQAALLERESRLQQALRTGGVMAFEWDLVADQVRHSQNASLILGLGSRDVLSGSELRERVHPDDRPAVDACLKGVAPDKPSYSMTFRFLRGDDDSEVWLEQVASAQFDSNGSAVRIGGLTTDITERKRFEEAISRAQQRAEQADHAKSIFLAATSHDLRQPLQTLRFLQGMLEEQRPDPEVQKIVAGIGHSIDTMSSMLSSLLDINRLETGNLRPSSSDFALQEIFDSVATDIIRSLEEKGLQWRVVRTSLIVRSDQRMLEEMLRNLLSNAIRYTDRGKILLGCRRANDKVRIEVRDSGIGIPGNRLPHIFDEYYRDPERGGFGLGLAIVRRLGEILGHKVEVRSTPGKGTGFSIEVPRGRAADISESVPKSSLDTRTFRGTVLVIEDETSVRSALNKLLNLRGISAVGVASMSDAIELIRQQALHPDLVLSDYNLPGPMNGIESIDALRAALGWQVPAIIMTGDIRSTTIDAVASSGIAVLVKPFPANELLQLIDRLHAARNLPHPC